MRKGYIKPRLLSNRCYLPDIADGIRKFVTCTLPCRSLEGDLVGRSILRRQQKRTQMVGVRPFVVAGSMMTFRCHEAVSNREIHIRARLEWNSSKWRNGPPDITMEQATKSTQPVQFNQQSTTKTPTPLRLLQIVNTCIHSIYAHMQVHIHSGK